MTIETSTKIVRAAGSLATTVDQDMIILNMATNHYVALDEIGQRIWSLIENPVQISAVCAQLAAEYAGKIKIGKVNSDEHGDLASPFHISAIPTLLIFKNGQVIEQMVGAKSKSAFKASLDKAIA